MRVLFHGGEPLLAPVKDFYSFYDQVKDLKNIAFGIQTNLVYKLNEKKLSFFKDILNLEGIGTSWDPNIRFGSNGITSREQDIKLWESNIKTLVNLGSELTLMVSLSRDVIEKFEPREILDYAISLGIKFILFERITDDGNSQINNEVLPSNMSLDLWLFSMYEQTLEDDRYLKIGNMFLDEIATSYVNGSHVANRCRGCEQKLITINANGTLSGCPNSAPTSLWGKIDENPSNFIKSNQRTDAICKELTRNSICLTCEVNDLCNGDCYKLKWDGDICSAPKTLFKYLKQSNKTAECSKLLIK
jgi:radical SAM protein with 4Fe4S-binding SPASM domain